MDKTLLNSSVSLAILVAIVAPSSAHAYLSPSDVFNPAGQALDQTQTMVQSSRFDSFVQAPPSLREGEQVVAAQQNRAAEMRAEAQKQLTAIDAEPVDTYVPATDTSEKPSLFNNDVNYAVRQKRIAEQKSNGPTIVIAGAGVSVDSHGNVLHSGAPLITSTGPETTLAFAALILAALCTLSFSFLQKKATYADSLSMHM